MYQSFAHHHDWSFEILDHMESDLGQLMQTYYMKSCVVV